MKKAKSAKTKQAAKKAASKTPRKKAAGIVPGELLIDEGEIKLNAGRRLIILQVANSGDRPIQVGSHYHFYETNSALKFERAVARGFRLNIPAGTAVRFEPGQTRKVELVEYAGERRVYGFNAEIMGSLE